MTDQVIIYQSEDGRTKLDVRLEDETVWLSQKQLTALFGKAKGTISEHIKHIFEDGELEERAVVRPFRTTARDGKTYEVVHYNLDMVLALGFRVRSPVAVRFRQWAADKLKEYLVKGFVLDDARLKNPKVGNDYFEELTRRIQDIRTSERRFYQKITDIYATSIDYDKSDTLTQTFFATVQNKVHYAIHGQTAAEVIVSRADAAMPNMGLTTWEGARIRKADAAIAKNYLTAGELRALNNLVEQYLIFAESQAERRVPMTMAAWITKLEGFLTLNDRELLQDAGSVSADLAKSHAEREFAEFRRAEDSLLESDFDRAVKELPAPKKDRKSGPSESMHRSITKYEAMWTSEAGRYGLVQLDNKPGNCIPIDLQTGGLVVIDDLPEVVVEVLTRMRSAGVRVMSVEDAKAMQNTGRIAD